MCNDQKKIFINNQQSKAIPFDISHYIQLVCNHLKVSYAHIEVTLFSPTDIAALNNRYFHRLIPTDTISFNLTPNEAITGDIYLCPQIIFENAIEYNSCYSKELKIVIIHSILHLLNYTDSTPELGKKMADMQNDLFLKLEHQ